MPQHSTTRVAANSLGSAGPKGSDAVVCYEPSAAGAAATAAVAEGADALEAIRTPEEPQTKDDRPNSGGVPGAVVFSSMGVSGRTSDGSARRKSWLRALGELGTLGSISPLKRSSKSLFVKVCKISAGMRQQERNHCASRAREFAYFSLL